jgi:hypothetical protein
MQHPESILKETTGNGIYGTRFFAPSNDGLQRYLAHGILVL